MKFRIFVKSEQTPEWSEDYNKDAITTLEEAEEWGRVTITQFNRYLRPHETKRTFIRVEEILEGEATDAIKGHDWEKTNLVTIMNEYFGSYDTVECKKCGITGRRPGVGPSIIRDPEYKAAGYGDCDQAVKLLARRKKMRDKRKESE